MGRTRNSGGRGETSGPRANLDDVRNLHLRYSRVRPQEIELAVVYLSGRVRVVFEQGLDPEPVHLEHLERTDDEEKARAR